MASYPLQELLVRWETERFTTEQIIGHILQHLTSQEKRILKLESKASKEEIEDLKKQQ